MFDEFVDAFDGAVLAFSGNGLEIHYPKGVARLFYESENLFASVSLDITVLDKQNLSFTDTTTLIRMILDILK